MSGPKRTRAEFLGLQFDALDLERSKDRVLELAQSERFAYVVTPNVDHVVRLHRSVDPAVRSAYAAPDTRPELVLCDSRILARLARSCGVLLPLVPGSDLTRHLLADPRCSGLRIAVVGGDARLRERLPELFPQVTWSFFEPPMRLRHDPAARRRAAAFIEQAKAAVCFVAVGAPQSEMICAEVSALGHARGVALCVGASLEFLAGAKVRAPKWVQAAGLEWLHRLLQEPRRLWRRYLVDGPRIFAIWWRWRADRVNRLVVSGSKPSDGS